MRDSFGILDNGGIGRVQTGYIRPVLVQIRIDRAGGQASGDIRSAPLEGVDPAVHIGAVKPGDHSPVQGQQGRTHGPSGHGIVELSVFIKTYTPGGIDKGEAQIPGEDLCSQIFPSAGRVIPVRRCLQRFLQNMEFLVEGKDHIQSLNDFPVSHLDLFQLLFKRFAGICLLVAVQKQIRHFDIFGETLSRCGDDYESPLRVVADDGADFAQLGGIRDGCAPELCDNDTLTHDVRLSNSVFSILIQYP